jgi:hypothetical protein
MITRRLSSTVLMLVYHMLFFSSWFPVHFDFLIYLFAADADIFLQCRRSYSGGLVLLLRLSLLESSSWDVDAFLYRWTSDPFDGIGIIWNVELVTTE